MKAAMGGVGRPLPLKRQMRIAIIAKMTFLVNVHKRAFLDTRFVLILNQTRLEMQKRKKKNILQPGDTVVEVGANLGMYTTLLAEVVGAGGMVGWLDCTY